jgi:hypothetical protein
MKLLKNVALSSVIATTVGIACFVGAGEFVLYYNGGPGPVVLDNDAGAGFAVALFALLVAVPVGMLAFVVSFLYLHLRKREPAQ